MFSDLKDKICLITGGAGGIGKASAAKLHTCFFWFSRSARVHTAASPGQPQPGALPPSGVPLLLPFGGQVPPLRRGHFAAFAPLTKFLSVVGAVSWFFVSASFFFSVLCFLRHFVPLQCLAPRFSGAVMPPQ